MTNRKRKDSDMTLKVKKAGIFYTAVAVLLISLLCSATAYADEKKITASTIEYGQALAESKISVSGDTDGKIYEWKEGDLIPQAGTKEYEAVCLLKGQTKDTGETVRIAVNVLPKSITVTAGDAERTYGTDNPKFEYAIAKDSLVGTDTKDTLGLRLKTDADKDSDVGEYKIVKDSCANANYDVEVTPGTLTITKDLAELRVDNSAISYGEPLPTAFVYHVTGLVNENDIDHVSANLFTDATMSSPSGIYRIAGTASAINYDVAVQAGTLKIEPNTVTNVDNLSAYAGNVIQRISITGDMVLHTDTKIEFRNLEENSEAYKAIQNEVKQGEQLILAGELSLQGTKVDQGSIKVTLPAGSEYNDQYVTVYHYVTQGNLDMDAAEAETAKLDIYEDIPVQDGLLTIEPYYLSSFAVKLQKDGTSVTSEETKSDPVETDVKVSNKVQNKSVHTGDALKSLIPYVVACVLAILLIAAVIIQRKRNKRN